LDKSLAARYRQLCLYVRVWHEDRLFFTTIYTIIAESGILDVAFRAVNFCEIVLGERKIVIFGGFETHTL